MESAKRISDALNSARILDLGEEDANNLQTLIVDFFGQNQDDNEPIDNSSQEGNSESDEELSDLDVESTPDADQPEVTMAVDAQNSDQVEPPVNDLGQDVIDAVGLDNFLFENDEEEMAKIRAKKCRCRNPYGGLGCSHKFDDAYVFKLRYQMNALSADIKAMCLLGKISSGIKTSQMTMKSRQASQTVRKKKRTMGYFVDGIRVCRDTFLFMHMLSDKFLTKLVNHYLENGIEVPRKASGGAGNNRNAFSAEDVIQTVKYITNYAEKNGMVIPGRVAGVKTSDPRVHLLPSSDSKTRVWKRYKEHFVDLNGKTGGNLRLVQRSCFHKIWNMYTPFVLTTQPRTDLCWTCQQHNRQIYQSANQSDEEKAAKLIQQQEHLRVVNQERVLYQQHVKESKAALTGKEMSLGEHAPCSMEGSMHYSFDFAQQVHYPNDPDQPGPMYFLTPRKCAVFGINCEAFPKQVNFLIDEGMSISKGSNAVISYLHFFFDNYGLGEEIARLHCDNCSGQNKNKFVMWYLAWRCIHRLHKSMELYFLVAGHTKFSPDWCFGLFKQRYRRSHITALCDIQEAVRTSSYQNINIPQLVGSEDGQVLVNTYNWQEFLSPYFKPLPQIKNYHHMRFDCDHPGVIFAKQYADSKEVSFSLLKDPTTLPPLELPLPLAPPGLSEQRIQYLYNNIRQFCAQDHRADLTCPVPGVLVREP